MTEPFEALRTSNELGVFSAKLFAIVDVPQTRRFGKAYAYPDDSGRDIVRGEDGRARAP